MCIWVFYSKRHIFPNINSLRCWGFRKHHLQPPEWVNRHSLPPDNFYLCNYCWSSGCFITPQSFAEQKEIFDEYFKGTENFKSGVAITQRSELWTPLGCWCLRVRLYMTYEICWESDYQTDGKFSLIQMWKPSQLLKIHNAISRIITLWRKWFQF